MIAPARVATGNVASHIAVTPLLEATESSSVLDLTPAELGPAMHRAQMRMQLHVAGRVHQLLLDAGAAAREALVQVAGPDGAVDGLGLNLVQQRLSESWRRFMSAYQSLLYAARRETVALASGALPVLHRHCFGRLLEESRGASLSEAVAGIGGVPFFQPQLDALLKAADDRLYSDGLRLSQRIWRLDEEGWAGIRGVVYTGVANGKSAYQIAQELQPYLGAGQECPRWTRYRLYGLTKTQVAGGRRGGLYAGDACREQGVAYKALRLARTELQYIHHLAAQETRKQMPFVEAEQIVLSPAHPRRDICDEVTEAAPNGDGVYAVGEIQLPLHPNCICDQRAVLMDDGVFVGRLRGWVDGSEPWREMDAYASWVGMETRTFTSPYLAGMELAFQIWWRGNEEDRRGRLVEAA